MLFNGIFVDLFFCKNTTTSALAVTNRPVNSSSEPWKRLRACLAHTVHPCMARYESELQVTQLFKRAIIRMNAIWSGLSDPVFSTATTRSRQIMPRSLPSIAISLAGKIKLVSVLFILAIIRPDLSGRLLLLPGRHLRAGNSPGECLRNIRPISTTWLGRTGFDESKPVRNHDPF